MALRHKATCPLLQWLETPTKIGYWQQRVDDVHIWPVLKICDARSRVLRECKHRLVKLFVAWVGIYKGECVRVF